MELHNSGINSFEKKKRKNKMNKIKQYIIFHTKLELDEDDSLFE